MSKTRLRPYILCLHLPKLLHRELTTERDCSQQLWRLCDVCPCLNHGCSVLSPYIRLWNRLTGLGQFWTNRAKLTICRVTPHATK